MDGRHQAVLDPDRLVKHLGHRRKAVGRARCVGDDVVGIGVVDVVEVHAQHDGRVGRLIALGGRRDDHLLSAGLQMLSCSRSRPKTPSGLDHHVDLELAPRQRPGIRLGQRVDVASVDRNPIVLRGHLSGKAPIDRVVLEQVREHCRFDEVVDRHNLDVDVMLLRGPQGAAPDTAKSVDCHSNSHLDLVSLTTNRDAGRRVRQVRVSIGARITASARSTERQQR